MSNKDEFQSSNHIIDQVSLGKIVQIRDKLLNAQKSGQKVYRFESGDPSFDVPQHVINGIEHALKNHKTHYTPNNGIPELREAIKNKLEKVNNIKLSSIDPIFVTNGAMNGLFAAFFALLDKGDEVILPDPMWTEIGENIKIAGGKPVPVNLYFENGYQYLPQDIEEKISSKTRAIYLNSPHNPTGSVLSKETLFEIIEIAKKHNLWIVTDEAYEHVIYKPEVHYSIASLAPEYSDRIISLFSLSKSYAMSGLRLGYLITTSKKLQERIPKILRCSINGVNSLSQWGAVAALSEDQSYIEGMVKEYTIRRDILFNALNDIPLIKPFKPRGAFYIWVELDPSIYEKFGCKNADELSNYLAELGIGSTPGDAFGKSCDNSMRFAFSCNTKMVEEGAIALKKALS